MQARCLIEKKYGAAINAEIAEGKYPMAVKNENGLYYALTYDFMLVEDKLSVHTSMYSEPATISGEESKQYDVVRANLETAGMTIDAEKLEEPELDIENYLNTQFSVKLQEEFNRVIESVVEFGGFYIGRYETSLNDGKIQSKANSSAMTAEASSGNSWYGLYGKQNSLYTGDSYSVDSGMIWGCQWDQALLWLKDLSHKVGEENVLYIINGTNMGWSSDTSEENPDRMTGKEISTEELTVSGKANNIFDMAGNLSEWTLETDIYGFNRIARGGNHTMPKDTIAPYQRFLTPPDSDNSLYGSRLQLILK